MGCRCNERSAAMVKTARAMAKGDLKTATEQTKFVMQSAVQDAGSALRKGAAAAKQRLMTRR